MFEYDLLPSSGETIEMIGLLGLGCIVKGAFKPAVFRTTITPFVTTAFVTIFIEECYFASGESIFVILITRYLFHKIGNSVLIITYKC